MANIQSNLNKIKNAVLGVEVRDSIHDGIKAINEEVENTTDRQVQLEGTFDELVINAGNSNAELIDGRTGSCGNVYTNIGEAIRTQVKNSISNNIVSKTFSTDDIINNTIHLPFEVYKGQEIEILVQSTDIISTTSKLAVGCSTGSQDVNDIAQLYANTTSNFIAPIDFKIIRIYVPNSAILTNGNFTVIINHKKNIYEQLKALNTFNLKQETENKELKKLLLGENGDNIEIKFKIENVSAVKSTTISQNISDVNIKQGDIVYFLLEDKNGVLNPNCEIAIGFNYVNSGLTLDQIKLKPNVENSILLSEGINGISAWCGGGNVLNDGNLKLRISNASTLSVMEMLKNKTSLNSQTMSIIGDSYSTYEGWIPNGYNCWYKESGNDDTNNDVASVEDTWWWQLSNETGLSLLVNNSYSGSTISTSGYSASDSTPTAFVTRMKTHMGEDRALQPKPNIIFIFGGTNDTWASSPVGSVKYSDWTTDDLKSVLPAFCYMVDYLQKWNPQARIINIVNTGLQADISNGMNTACKYYGIENVVLNDISKTGGHPNKAGMTSIKNQVISIL